MRKLTYAVVAGAVALTTACKDSTAVQPLDAPTAAALSGALTRGGFQTIGVGLIAADRAIYVGSGATYTVLSGIFARDLVRVDASEPRYVSETLGGTPDAGSFAGGGGFGGAYTAIRSANTILAALNAPAAGAFTTGEISAARGFARTFKALEYYRVLELRDTIGIALQPDDPNTTTPGVIICKTVALNMIAALLDTANADLQAATAAGTANIPFDAALPPSFSTTGGRNYRSVANFTRFNRGLKGKVDVYRGLNRPNPNPAAFTAAIAELTQALGGAAPGTVAGSTFQNGLYAGFVPGGTEAAPNGLSDNKVGAYMGLKDSVLAGDTRTSKIVLRSSTAPATLTGQGITTTYTLARAVASTANQSLPIGILRDEELVLLRAQAYFEAGQFANGYADLNSVHTFYGNAPWAVSTTLTTARNNLLYDKRFSLLGEGPQRLVDLRAYSRLNSTFFRPAVTGDPFNSAFPIPKGEQDARAGSSLTPVCS